MMTLFGLVGLAIILFALSRAEGEPADYYETRYPELFAQVDRNPKGHDPAEGRGRNDESPVAATSGDAPKGVGHG